jgi:hypothetical protein
MATLTVGSGQTYASLATAAAVAKSGDVIDVEAGTYRNDFATLPAGVTVQAVGGMVTLEATTSSPNGAILTTSNGTVTLDDPPALEMLQTVTIATVAPGVAGDTLELVLEKPVPLGSVVLSGTAVIYTAPNAIAASMLDTIGFQIVDLTHTSTTSATATVQLDSGPTLIASSGAVTLAPGATAILGNAEPGLPGDVLTLVPIGTFVGSISLDAADHVIYTAPGTVAGPTTVSVRYQVVDQANDVGVTRTETVKVVPRATLTLDAVAAPKPGVAETVATLKPSGTADAVTLSTIAAPANGTLSFASNVLRYTNTLALAGAAVDTAVVQITDQSAGLSQRITAFFGGDGNLALNGGQAGESTFDLGGGNDTITLHGTTNFVTAGNGNDIVTGGSGAATIRLGNGSDTVEVGGGGNHITLGSGVDLVSLSAASNVVVFGSGTDTLVGKSGDQVSFTGTNGRLTVSGTHETVSISAKGADSAVVDHGTSLEIVVSAGCGTVTVDDAAADPHILIDLKGGVGGFTTAAGVLAALLSDGAGGSLLSLGSGAEVHFVSAAPSLFSAANFKLG